MAKTKKTPDGEQMKSDMYFKFVNDERIEILRRNDNKIIGHIFTPSSSDNGNLNCVQVCGFNEAFDFWGCGIFHGKKDIQLLFDKNLGINPKEYSPDECYNCYTTPCSCERPTKDATGRTCSPFTVKRESQLLDRIKRNKPRITIEEVESWNKNGRNA